ncbi:secreted RxLR effector protein 161-like [Daucus carota subsp. sativus]|uniref:secreted RxLR effector protein 161-like n=1 Tax=Daucus carota subsp. sativus TaxID=79200 RepID=UPI003082ECC3
MRTLAEASIKFRIDSTRESVNPTLFKSLVGSLRYLTFTRPDIMYAVGLVSRYMEKPKQDHFMAAKRILRYIKGTLSNGLFYTHSQDSKLVGYSDSDYGGDLDDGKSTSGYAFHIGSAIFSWSSKKQQTVALSTCEAEYIAAAACACQAIWLSYILGELNLIKEEPALNECEPKKEAAAQPGGVKREDRITPRIKVGWLLEFENEKLARKPGIKYDVRKA